VVEGHLGGGGRGGGGVSGGGWRFGWGSCGGVGGGGGGEGGRAETCKQASWDVVGCRSDVVFVRKEGKGGGRMGMRM